MWFFPSEVEIRDNQIQILIVTVQDLWFYCQGIFLKKECVGISRWQIGEQTFFEHALWHGDLIPPTQYRTCVPCNRSMEPSLLEARGAQETFYFPLWYHRILNMSPVPHSETLLFIYSMYMLSLAAQLCLTLCDPLDCSPPGSSVHGISQAEVLEWVAISFSRGSSWCRVWTSISCVSCIEGRFLTNWALKEAWDFLIYWLLYL